MTTERLLISEVPFPQGTTTGVNLGRLSISSIFSPAARASAGIECKYTSRVISEEEPEKCLNRTERSSDRVQ